MTRQAEQRDETNPRKERIPMGGPRYKLSAPQREGYHRHWFNDRGSRCYDAEQAGYTYVLETRTGDADVSNTSGLGSKTSKVVDRDDAGHIHAFLMEIPQEWYDEDQALKAGAIADVTGTIQRGALTGEPGQDGKYVPKGGIKYEP